MTIKTFAYHAVLFVAGIIVGALWSPRSRDWPISAQRPDSQRGRVRVDTDFDKTIAEIGSELGQEAATFAEQFKDLTIRVKKYPFDAGASPDGRFVIRLFGNTETVASDLRSMDVNELIRHYSFSRGDKTYSCDFIRSIKDSEITDVQFRMTDAAGRELCYVDLDGDGRWDKFIDETETPPNYYVREGLCWKKQMNDAGDSKDCTF